MSIKLLARDLYRCRCEIEELEKKLALASGEKKAALSDSLRRLRAEKDQLRKALDGQIGR